MKRPAWLAVGIAAILAIVGAAGLMWWQRQRLPIVDVSIQSAALSSFWHRPTAVRARVLLPPSYWNDPQRTYPAVYDIHALGTSYLVGRRTTRVWQKAVAASGTDFIVVFLDAAMPAGEHHAFADSANNGPWASALVHDFIPQLEKKFRIQGTPGRRFLTGHSSGGWAALWLQVNYPKFFGGAWSSAPDPVDFHDFIGMNLLGAPLPNAYRIGGKERELVRGTFFHPTQSLRAYVRKEDASGAHGQFASFDAAFGPRAGAKPRALFDHRTGKIDPVAARYWEDHYDIDGIVRKRWPTIGGDLQGKLHVFVGAIDTYHLEGPVRLLGEDLQQRQASAEIVVAPGRDHTDIARWHGGLTAYELTEMAKLSHQ